MLTNIWVNVTLYVNITLSIYNTTQCKYKCYSGPHWTRPLLSAADRVQHLPHHPHPPPLTALLSQGLTSPLDPHTQ